VGAYYANPSDKSNAGKSYVVFGKQDNAAINLSAIAAGTGLPVRVSLPAPATKISALLVVVLVRVLAFSSPR
jgi:hypothetical protein